MNSDQNLPPMTGRIRINVRLGAILMLVEPLLGEVLRAISSLEIEPVKCGDGQVLPGEFELPSVSALVMGKDALPCVERGNVGQFIIPYQSWHTSGLRKTVHPIGNLCPEFVVRVQDDVLSAQRPGRCGKHPAHPRAATRHRVGGASTDPDIR